MRENILHSHYLSDMKTFIPYILLVALMTYGCIASASQVYKCVDEAGNVSFGYTPCPVEIVNPTGYDKKESVEERMEKISSIDGEIARLQREMRDLRLNLEYRLKRTEEVDQQHLLREEFQSQTTELLDTLSRLRNDRGELVNDAVKILMAQKNS